MQDEKFIIELIIKKIDKLENRIKDVEKEQYQIKSFYFAVIIFIQLATIIINLIKLF